MTKITECTIRNLVTSKMDYDDDAANWGGRGRSVRCCVVWGGGWLGCAPVAGLRGSLVPFFRYLAKYITR